MINDLIGFFVEPVIDVVARPFIKVALLQKMIEVEQVNQVYKKCDFCEEKAESRLGSGLLCGYHYNKLIN